MQHFGGMFTEARGWTPILDGGRGEAQRAGEQCHHAQRRIGHPECHLPMPHLRIVERFGEGTYYFSTFGGNPVAARAALAVFDVIDDLDLITHAGAVGVELTRLLEELRGRQPLIRDIRAHGMLVGVELGTTERRSSAEVAVLAANGLRRRGVLVGRTGPRFDVLKIRPPLVFGSEDAATLAEALDATLTELERG